MKHLKKLEQFYTKAAIQFCEDGLMFYADKDIYDPHYNVALETYPLWNDKEIILIEDKMYDLFEKCRTKFTPIAYNTFVISTLVSQSITELVIENKFVTDKSMFLTIRPSDKMDIKRFKDMVIKLLSKKILRSYILVYEQKGESYANIGKGKHIHAILRFNYNMEMKSHRQKIKQFCDSYKCIYDMGKPLLPKYLKDKIYYMGLLIEDGELQENPGDNYKDEPEKWPALPYDKIFRNRNELEFETKNVKDIIEKTSDY